MVSLSSSKDDITIVSVTPRESTEIPPNVPFVPIDRISFHNEDNVQGWKYVVQH